RARGGAGALLGAGLAAVPARLSALGTGPLALGQLRRAGAMARRRDSASRGCEREANEPREDKCGTVRQDWELTIVPSEASTLEQAGSPLRVRERRLDCSIETPSVRATLPTA